MGDMQVLLKHSAKNNDIECSICRQGFRLYWEPISMAERATMRAIVQGELRLHHRSLNNELRTAHPEQPFHLPEWAGDYQFSCAEQQQRQDTLRPAQFSRQR
jgi:hypothetical protein